MAITFDEPTRALRDGLIFPSVATLGPDGSPRSSVVWAHRDGDTLLFATGRDSRKGRDLARDPRVSLTVADPANPYRSVELRGTAELSEDGARELLAAMSQHYLGQQNGLENDGVTRVVVRVVPDKVIKFGF